MNIFHTPEKTLDALFYIELGLKAWGEKNFNGLSAEQKLQLAETLERLVACKHPARLRALLFNWQPPEPQGNLKNAAFFKQANASFVACRSEILYRFKKLEIWQSFFNMRARSAMSALGMKDYNDIWIGQLWRGDMPAAPVPALRLAKEVLKG
jgi:hypothetical protein